ncbi:PREDICTED: fatty acid hydroxylase domain-containing protein 2-like, partial [Rhagoletis zephyria]|uniref:fatty acid hydroxylase domain-containing protein 2-like n=1 Tax=Rhagoletis zephyria TaxID=28612 RepID=UPI0008112CEB
MSSDTAGMIDHLHNLASVFALVNQAGGYVHGHVQAAYDWYFGLFGRDYLVADIAGGMIITMTVFWVLGALYTVLDLTHWPAALYQYKTQDKEVTFAEVLHTAKLALLNQLTVQLLTTVAYHFLLVWRGLDESPRVPPVATMLSHLLVYVLVQETSFYYLHRLLHRGRLYRYVHKVHHYWQAPIAISAIYCHPAEHLLANLVPVLLGPLVMGSHRCTISLWLMLVHFVTLNDHSGYHFPMMPSPEFHDYHHL